MIAVVGAGMGGLSAAACLARAGRRVEVFEARSGPGGLASSFEAGGLRFDAGPYVLLDRPGLEWAFRELGAELREQLDLIRLDEVYQVEIEDGPTVAIPGDLQRAASLADALRPGAGAAYADFVEKLGRIYDDLQPLQYLSRPGPGRLLRSGAWRRIPFLLRSLSGVMAGAGLPEPLVRALSIWTHVAGQRPEEAPSPLAFIPALIHRHGAFVPRGGLGQVPLAFEKIARDAGAVFHYGAPVRKILTANGRVRGIEVNGERLDVEAVVSDAGALRTYLDLLDETPPSLRAPLEALPLQSPGVCAYLSIPGAAVPPFLKFRLPREGLCRLLITPGAADPSLAGTARLLGPVDGARTQGSQDYLDRLLAEPWWKPPGPAPRVLASRTTAQWGAEFNLYRDSMNPVMTASFMRRGRIPHRSAEVGGLFLAGSSTHPGQWISFCAISGVLAARELLC